MPQGILPFEYEEEKSSSGMTSLGGLPTYPDLTVVIGLTDSIRKHIKVSGEQGWTDVQVIVSLVLLNLSGGECVEDLKILEKDEGVNKVLRRIETHGMKRRERRELERRWRKARQRSVPSPSATFRYLEGFHDEEEELKREEGRAFIPSSNKHLQGLTRVNADMISFLQSKSPQSVATLDQDATLIETHKSGALHCYKGYKAYQPLNTWWDEQGVVIHSEFRDGNVPAGHEQKRVLEESLDCLPPGVKKVFLRSDTAGYQHELLKYCAEGKNPRFGVIKFAVGVDVTDSFKKAVGEVSEEEWNPLYRKVNGKLQETNQEWTEVCYVPSWVARSKKGPEYRFIAIRESLGQLELPGMETEQQELPFPTMEFNEVGRYKVSGIVTNRQIPGEELIRWHRKRCGRSEQVHAVMKDDLTGGKLPSKNFGANAAWWQIMLLSLNLNSIMKSLVIGESWTTKRMKAIRFSIINLPGRIVEGGGKLIIRLTSGHPTNELILKMRERIMELACAPSG